MSQRKPSLIYDPMATLILCPVSLKTERPFDKKILTIAVENLRAMVGGRLGQIKIEAFRKAFHQLSLATVLSIMDLILL